MIFRFPCIIDPEEYVDWLNDNISPGKHIIGIYWINRTEQEWSFRRHSLNNFSDDLQKIEIENWYQIMIKDETLAFLFKMRFG